MTVRRGAVALGYQGYGNVGDEAILAGIEEMLNGSAVDITAIVGGDVAKIAAFPQAARITGRRLHPRMASLKALRRAHVLVMTGGGLLHDHWWSVVPLYFSWTLLARLSGRRVLWVGIGAGPLDRPLTRNLVRWIMALASLMTVRDEASATLLRSIGHGKPVTVIPDPAFFLPPPPDMSPRNGLGIVVRAPTPRDRSLTGTIANALADLGAGRLTAGGDVSMLTMAGQRDRPFAELVATLTGQRCGITPRIEELEPDPTRALRRFAQFDLVVSMRLHGLILSAIARTPCVPIVYEPKVKAVADQLGLGNVAVPIDNPTREHFARAILSITDTQRQVQVAAHVAAFRHRAAGVRQLIEAAAL